MFYVIDKPLGISSFDVIRRLRKTLGIKRMWHAGTLDPLATGCMLIAVWKSTKLLSMLEKCEKTYLFTVDISRTSPSLDMWTPVSPVDTSCIIQRTPEEIVSHLLSLDSQVPPIYSALHIDGERAYEKARRGESINLKSRDIHISHAECISLEGYSYTFRVRISSGWYIRSLAPEIAWFVWADWWWVITSLRREAIHTPDITLDTSMMVSLDSISDTSSARGAWELFPSISRREIDENLYTQLIQWKEIQLEGTYILWQKIFLQYKDIFTSLVEFHGDSFRIIRNDI